MLDEVLEILTGLRSHAKELIKFSDTEMFGRTLLAFCEAWNPDDWEWFSSDAVKEMMQANAQVRNAVPATCDLHGDYAAFLDGICEVTYGMLEDLEDELIDILPRIDRMEQEISDYEHRALQDYIKASYLW